MRLTLELDTDTTQRLMASAVRQLRAADMEAYRLLREALGLPVPWPVEEEPFEAEAVGDA